MNTVSDAMRAAWETIEACGSISDAQMDLLRDGLTDSQVVAAYLAYLDRRIAATRDPREHETCKRLAGNVMKLAAW